MTTMSRKSKGPAVDTIKLRALHTAYKTVDEIAAEMDMSPSFVTLKLESLGYKPRYEREQPSMPEFMRARKNEKKTESEEKAMPAKTSEEKQAAILKGLSDGKSVKAVSVENNVSGETVRRIRTAQTAQPAAEPDAPSEPTIKLTDNLEYIPDPPDENGYAPLNDIIAEILERARRDIAETLTHKTTIMSHLADDIRRLKREKNAVEDWLANKGG
jgi:transposase-like protein